MNGWIQGVKPIEPSDNMDRDLGQSRILKTLVLKNEVNGGAGNQKWDRKKRRKI